MIEKERGQAMVLIVLGIVGLIAIVGLALDGGQLHNNRRQLQNAADASALAGARVVLDSICDGGAERAAVSAAIKQFAHLNGVDITSPDATYVYQYVDGAENVLTPTTSKVPVDTKGISITMMLTETTTFMKIVGQNDMRASAFALAMIGPVTQLPAGSNLLPIAVPDDVVIGLPPETEFNIDNDRYCNLHSGECIGDVGDASSQRGWLNFDYIYNTAYCVFTDPLRRTHKATTNAAAILDYIKPVSAGGKQSPPIFMGTAPDPLPPAEPVTLYIDGDFIHGEPGEIASDAKEVFNYWADQVVFLPVFDKVYAPNYMDDHDALFPEPLIDSGAIKWPNQNQYMYHIIGFAAVEVCDPNTDPDCDSNLEQKDLVGTFKQVIIGQGQIDPTQPIPCSSMLTAVILWK